MTARVHPLAALRAALVEVLDRAMGRDAWDAERLELLKKGRLPGPDPAEQEEMLDTMGDPNA